MSIRLSYTKLRDEAFISGLSKIYRFSGFKDIAFMQRIVRFTRLVNKYMQEGQEVFVNLVKQYALVDENKNLIPPEKGGDYQIPPENEKAWLEKLKEFGETEIDLFCDEFSVSSFSEVGLTPAELDALEPIFIKEA